MFHKYFVPSCSLLLYFLIWCLFRSRSFEFWQCLLYQYFPFIIIVFPVLRNFCLPRIVNIFLSVFSQKLDAISFYKGLCYMWGYISCMIRSRGQSSFSFSIMNIYLFWHRVKKQNNFFFFSPSIALETFENQGTICGSISGSVSSVYQFHTVLIIVTLH